MMNVDLSVVDVLELAEAVHRQPARLPEAFRVGVDLGTAECVLTVVDEFGAPVYVSSRASGALKDGVVLDFGRAVETVAELKDTAESVLGADLEFASTAFPPQIPRADAVACSYVLDAAGFEPAGLIDEVSAAWSVLRVDTGVIVDVGGGSTGVGVFESGRLVHLDDVPGGGTHLDLILAGALGISTEEAERVKRTQGACMQSILRPGVERVAESVRRLTKGWEHLDVHIAGGALMLPGAADIVSQRLGRRVITYPHSRWITPVGIAKEAR